MTRDQIVENLVSVAGQLSALIVWTLVLCLGVVILKLVSFEKLRGVVGRSRRKRRRSRRKGRRSKGKGRVRGTTTAEPAAEKPSGFKIFGASVSIDHAWIVLFVLSLVHVYFGWLFLRVTAWVVDCDNRALAQQAWVALTGNADDLRLFYGLEPREPRLFGSFWISTVGTEGLLRDPALWFHAFAIAVISCATSRVFRAKRWLRVVTITAAIVIGAGNWVLASQWMLAAGDIRRVELNEPLAMRSLHDRILETTRGCPLQDGSEGP